MKIIKYHKKVKNKIVKRKRPLDHMFILLVSIFLFGLLFGSFVIKLLPESSMQRVEDYITQFYKFSCAQSYFSSFLFSVKLSTMLLFFLYFLGTSFLGSVILWIFPYGLGFILGIFSGFLYKSGGVLGLLYFSSFFLVPSAFLISCCILCCKESILTAKDFRSILSSNHSLENPKKIIQLYSIRYGMFWILSLFASTCYLICLIFLKNKVIPTFLH